MGPFRPERPEDFEIIEEVSAKMSFTVNAGRLELLDERMGVGVEYEPGMDMMRVAVWFLVDSMEWEARPEEDPVLGALRMAEEVVSRLKAEAFNRQMAKRGRP